MNNVKTEHVNCNLCGSKECMKLYTIEKSGYKFQIVKCQKCGLVFQNPRIKEIDIEKIYDKDYFHAKGFDRDYCVEAKKFDKFEIAKDVRRINIIERFCKKGKMLEIGCAYGKFLYEAEKLGWKVYGLDISPYAVRFAGKYYKLDVKVGTLDTVKYPSNFFDCIVMIEVIEHLTDPKKTLKEINRILKLNGLIVIQTSNVDSLISKIKGPKWGYYNFGHLYLFSRKTLKRYLNDAGFELVKGFFGDEIGLKTKMKGYWLNKKFNITNFLIYCSFIMTQLLRSFHIGEFSFGGMTFYAKKLKSV